MELPDKLTTHQAYGAAMKMTDAAQAKEYFNALVQRNMRLSGNSLDEAESIERANLGYYAGYYDNETRERVERLFACAHPAFGKIAEAGAPTPDEAFRLGQEMARRSRG